MIWYCDICKDWGAAETEVDAVVDKRRHMNAHRSAEAPPPAVEEEEQEDTVLRLKYVAWGITVTLGLLSSHFHSLVGVVPCAALILFIVTGMADD